MGARVHAYRIDASLASGLGDASTFWVAVHGRNGAKTRGKSRLGMENVRQLDPKSGFNVRQSLVFEGFRP